MIISKTTRITAELGLSGRVILTFDDGPNPDTGISSALLEVLANHEVTAGFCYVGQNAAAAPAIVERTVTAGNRIHHHTWSHELGALLSAKRLARELEQTAAFYREVLGKTPRGLNRFRPPLGIRKTGRLVSFNGPEGAVLPLDINPRACGRLPQSRWPVRRASPRSRL